VPPIEVDVSSNAPDAPADETTQRPPSAADVTNAIEYERVELMQIQAMLKCLYRCCYTPMTMIQ
jgi:hypothetical protein